VLPGHLGSVHGKSQILGHDSVNVNGLGTTLLKLLSELGQLGSVVELGSESQTSSPSEDGSDGVGRGLVTLLEFTVVTGDSS
jgi:hypothetical protein